MTDEENELKYIVHVTWDNLKLVTRNQLVQRVEVYYVHYYSPEPVTDEEKAF